MIAWVPMSGARSAPLFVVVLFAFLVCAVSVGHAEPVGAGTCTVIDTRLPTASTFATLGDIVGALASAPIVPDPQPSVRSAPVSETGDPAGDLFADTPAPRAPPAV